MGNMTRLEEAVRKSRMMQVDVIVVFQVCWPGPSLPIASRRVAAGPEEVRATQDPVYPFIEPTYILASTPAVSHKRPSTFVSPTFNTTLTNF
jgi:hypothetical protein